MKSEYNSFDRPDGQQEFTIEEEQFVLESDLQLVKSIVTKVDQKLKALGWNQDDIEIVTSAVDELVVNGIAHGNQGLPSYEDPQMLFDQSQLKTKNEPTEKKVYVTTKLTPQKAMVIVRDEGKGFIPTDEAEQALKDENLLRPTGRGYLIMKHQLDDILYEIDPNRGGTVVTIRLENKEKN